jgi:hypothetical protein
MGVVFVIKKLPQINCHPMDKNFTSWGRMFSLWDEVGLLFAPPFF